MEFRHCAYLVLNSLLSLIFWSHVFFCSFLSGDYMHSMQQINQTWQGTGKSQRGLKNTGLCWILHLLCCPQSRVTSQSWELPAGVALAGCRRFSRSARPGFGETARCGQPRLWPVWGDCGLRLGRRKNEGQTIEFRIHSSHKPLKSGKSACIKHILFLVVESMVLDCGETLN